MSTEKLISEVDGSMSIEGMCLTDDDKNRIRYCIENPKKLNDILKQLIDKHTHSIGATKDVGQIQLWLWMG